jgi:hypothetical protein
MKLAYPVFDAYQPLQPIANLRKWVEAFRNMSIKMNLGATKTAAFLEITKEWSKPEQFQFHNWLKYYESGDQNKYKTAQYYVNEDINYFLPNPLKKVEAPSPLKSLNEVAQDAAQIVQQTKPELPQEDRRKIIEDQRRKLLSRLNSVEKLLGSQQGHLFAGKDFENLLHSIYELKKQIQTINKVSLSQQTYVDLIIRQANILNRKGSKIASEFMTKFAQQLPGNGQFNIGETPASGSVPQGLGSLENPTPSLTPPPDLDDPDAPKQGIEGFLDNMEGGGVTNGDELEADDQAAADDVILDEDDVLLDQEVGPREELMVEAQMAPDMPNETLPEETGNIEEAQAKPQPVKKEVPEEKASARNIDAIIDSAFSQITPEDYLRKLQEISAIFQKKEILRQLSIADLMGQKLGLSSYFTEYSELQQKMLDATNYINTRLNSIISTLEGSIGKSTINLNPENSDGNDPKTRALQQYLESQQKKEKEQKQLRKDVENQQLQEKAVEKPELEVESPAAEIGAETPAVEAPMAPTRAPAIAPGV